VVIMGKNTFLSIGKPLPNRENIVVSTTLKSADGCKVVRSLEEAINSSKENFPNKDIFLIGGYAIYKSGEIFADTLYLTEVDIEVEGDVSLPDFDWKSWKEMEREDFFDEGSGINCALIKYVKSS
jgi:dihydrofolate reductase